MDFWIIDWEGLVLVLVLVFGSVPYAYVRELYRRNWSTFRTAAGEGRLALP